MSPDGGWRRRRKRRGTSGTAFPSVESPMATGGDDAYQPVPIVLHTRTVLKLLAPFIGIILSGVATAVYFYFDTKTHTKSQVLHLRPGERSSFESKADARNARKKMIEELGREHQLMLREIKADTAETIREVRRIRGRRR